MSGMKNYEYFRFLNPFDPMFWIDFDLEYEKDEYKEDKPEYTYDDFVDVFGVEFWGYIEEGNTLHPLWKAFRHISVDLISYDLVGKDEDLWKFLVSMYLGHQLELAMARLKNTADEISLTPEKPSDKKITYKISNPQSIPEQLQVTKYGFIFWQTYSPYLKFRHFGIYTNRGKL